MVAFEFEGTTVYYNAALLVPHSVVQSLNPAIEARSILNKKQTFGAINNGECAPNCCGGSSFQGTLSPWPSVPDCVNLSNAAYGMNAYFYTTGQTLMKSGHCAFSGSANGILDTFIGSQDIGDLSRSALQQLQVRAFPIHFLAVIFRTQDDTVFGTDVS